MDLQQHITEAIEEHLTVIQQLTAISISSCRWPASWSPLSDVRGRWSCVGMEGVPAMPNISPLKCRVSVHIPTRLRDCWRSS